VVLPPTPDVLGLTAESFWEVLRDSVRPSHIVAGFNFNFGKARGGSVKDMQRWSEGTAIQVHVEPPMEVSLLGMQLAPVSSSLIRWLLAHGRVRDAAICLGRPYALFGKVIRGFGRGRQIGVPTANLGHDGQLAPAEGVYAARCTIGGATYPTAVSIGHLPTFGDNVRQVEAHLIGFAGDLYDQTIRVEFIDWIREQRKFDGLEPLKARIASDIESAKTLSGRDPSLPIAVLGDVRS
jgi:riboflavin kinase/FMN adenylyltransferase